MKNGRMQCKDIPDAPIINFIESFGGEWCNWWDGSEKDVRLAFPQGRDTPTNLFLAKMGSLIRRKKIDGCACGCRGDFAPIQTPYQERS